MTTQTQLTPSQQNTIAREMLLQTGISMVKQLPVNAGNAPGANIQIPLQRMGILTGVMLHFTVDMDITSAATASAYGPWNLVQNISYTDFAGVNRTNTNGWQLYAGQALKALDLPGVSSYGTAPDGISGIGAINTNILQQPTAVNATAQMQFGLYLPIAYDPTSDLRGAVMTQTNIGEHYITINTSNAMVGTDPWACPYTAGTITGTTISVQAYQMYIQPQNMTAAMLPLIDLSTIYGFEGGYKTTANIAGNQSTFINYPNNRSILGTLINYENGGAFTLNETDISLVTMLVNSNTHFRELSPRLVREQMRHMLKGDLPSGTYYLGSRRQPILTQQYANVQAKMDVVTANAGTTQFLSQFEVLYPSGTPLPGVTP